MSRTLLPPWSIYAENVGVYAKEKPETFEWIPYDRRDYEAARDALDSTPGAREWLKNYEKPADGFSFSDPFGHALLCKFGDWHSGASVTMIAHQYKHLLNDWDGFVLAVKTNHARKNYDKKQMTIAEITDFIRTCETYEEEAHDAVFTRLCTTYTIDQSQGRTAIIGALHTILAHQQAEAETAEYLREQRRFNEDIDTLEFIYAHPQRWNDHGRELLRCSLFGPITWITDEMFAEMEARHPGYTAHIDSIIANGV